MLQISQQIDRHPGPEVEFDCPSCGGKGVTGFTYDERRQERLYWLIPVSNSNSSWVACSQCGKALRSRLPAAQLANLGRERLASVLFVDPGFVRKAVAVISAILAIFPFVGTIFAAIVVIANWKVRAWPRTVSIASLIVSIAFWVVAAGVVFLLVALGVID